MAGVPTAAAWRGAVTGWRRRSVTATAKGTQPGRDRRSDRARPVLLAGGWSLMVGLHGARWTPRNGAPTTHSRELVRHPGVRAAGPPPVPHPHQARMAVFDFVEGFYNSRRRHSALGQLSPPTMGGATKPDTLQPSPDPPPKRSTPPPAMPPRGGGRRSARPVALCLETVSNPPDRVRPSVGMRSLACDLPCLLRCTASLACLAAGRRRIWTLPANREPVHRGVQWPFVTVSLCWSTPRIVQTSSKVMTAPATAPIAEE